MIGWWWRDWGRVWGMGQIGRAYWRRRTHRGDLSTEDTTLDHYARQEVMRLIEGTSHRIGLVGQLTNMHQSS